MKNSVKILFTVAGISIVLMAVGAWLFFSEHYMNTAKPATADKNEAMQDGSKRKVLYWHDPMVPGHKFDKPGKSPFMDMQLVPQYADDNGTEGESGVRISSTVAHNLGIRVVPAAMFKFGESLSAPGRIEVDEHHLHAVQTRIAGFIERLYVRAAGDRVTAGQKIADIYAPELLAAQQEFLSLLQLKNVVDAETLHQSARQRLQLLGMANSEITAITKTGKANPRYGVYAQASGVVTELMVREGAQTMPGTSLLQLADLSTLWLLLEIPERDAARIKAGDRVEVQLESLPAQTITGRVNYFYPVLDAATRSVRVRVTLPNHEGKLQPGMFATARLTGTARDALAVPSEAIISTGIRNVVIVKDGDRYRPAEVRLGQETDGNTEILQGLEEGESVVASGQFLIDSEASLKGVLARLSTTSVEAMTRKETGAFAKVINIDSKTGSVTLDHEAIAALNWPSMTMSFKLRHPEQLHGIKAGDSVRFEVNVKPEGDDYLIEHLVKEIQP